MIPENGRPYSNLLSALRLCPGNREASWISLPQFLDSSLPAWNLNQNFLSHFRGSNNRLDGEGRDRRNANRFVRLRFHILLMAWRKRKLKIKKLQCVLSLDCLKGCDAALHQCGSVPRSFRFLFSFFVTRGIIIRLKHHKTPVPKLYLPKT